MSEETKKIEKIIKDIPMPSSLRDLGMHSSALERRTGCKVRVKKLDWGDWEIEVSEGDK